MSSDYEYSDDDGDYYDEEMMDGTQDDRMSPPPHFSPEHLV
jgi:ariadne-1